ncbi:GMC family oxidoreductase N-terminal domain-containing protein [Streptomyces nogalater]
MAATRELGHTGTGLDYNGVRQEGGGFYYQTTRTAAGRRSSAATAYLRPALDRSNLDVQVEARVTQVLFDGRRAAGVEYVKDGRTHTVAATQEVILSAGAFESPKLLMLSGIGPAAHLGRYGIRALADLPGSGPTSRTTSSYPSATRHAANTRPARCCPRPGCSPGPRPRARTARPTSSSPSGR